jgi:hypothetical protein
LQCQSIGTFNFYARALVAAKASHEALQSFCVYALVLFRDLSCKRNSETHRE